MATKAIKSEIRFDTLATDWLAIELLAADPFLLVRCSDGKHSRHLLLHGMDDLLSVYEQFLIGIIVDLSRVHPPQLAPSGTWQVTPMVALHVQLKNQRGPRPSVVIQAQDGVLYGGHPIKMLTEDSGPMHLLYRL